MWPGPLAGSSALNGRRGFSVNSFLIAAALILGANCEGQHDTASGRHPGWEVGVGNQHEWAPGAETTRMGAETYAIDRFLGQRAEWMLVAPHAPNPDPET
jgi:hypothetical protein